MSVYPNGLDSDQTIPRVDDALSEMGVEVINALRDAVFALQKELGIKVSGSASSVVNRLNKSLNPDGSIKASALTSIGLVTLPIDNAQIGAGAGIEESKLDLDYSTSSLYTLTQSNASVLGNLVGYYNTIESNFNAHLAGSKSLSDGDLARHVASHIDLNGTPNDSRDLSYTWSGLKDKDGNNRSATHVASALSEINDALVNHENATENAHQASAVQLDVTKFIEIPETTTDVQKLADYIDDYEVLKVGEHRATQHANAIPRIARGQDVKFTDGRALNVVPTTTCHTYLVHPPSTSPVEDLSTGDDIIKFVPDNSNYIFDSQFSQVKPGDRILVNYGNGIEGSFLVDSIRYSADSTWIVRINGVNLCESVDGYASARIDRPNADKDTSGILAVAAANATPTGSFTTILTGLIVGDPKGASVLGLGFDPNQLNSDHYKLYLELYPTGNPKDKVISLPAIDVTGNAGATPGKYTLERVVQATNNAFRAIGYNYRFIAYSFEGEFGLMLADSISGASFAIISGKNSSGTLVTDTYTENVLGGSTLDNFDAFGFGSNGANVASPAYQPVFSDAVAAQLPTKVISPLKRRNFYVNGQRRDAFNPTYLANSDGYWDGYVSARNTVGAFTVETTYTVEMDLAPAGLKPGKTIVVQPAVGFSDVLYNDADYGRFVIKSVNFISPCGDSGSLTQITVINSIHGTGSGVSPSAEPTLPVRLYFSSDSVGVNVENVISQIPTSLEYHRLHEVFINQDGKTFSHERARMPRQAETLTDLGTEKFHIRNVSAKLRGYKGSSVTDYRRKVRFYVLNYDSVTGEYEGYLGQAGTAAQILRPGNVTKARKNIPARFYDETNVDFIEIEFTDDNVAPGLPILGSASPRYVDIDIYPSLQLQDENLLLATCEVNWDPGSGQDVVQFVRDARQYGSIDESDLTSSVIDFINAGNKYLHENGVIKGYDFDSVGSDGEVFFKGGLAHVNGKIVASSNSSITIPQIHEDGTVKPQVVTWAVCINESGNLVPILVTSSKKQFFAEGASSYYVPSVTFAELVNSRKDLTPIYLVSATIASITIGNSDVKDVRRFVNLASGINPIVWSSDDLSGNFKSFDALKNWVNNYATTGKNLVRLKGTFTISSTVDLTSLTSEVAFEGDGAVINVTSAKGFSVGSNVSFRNIKFNYTPPELTYATNDRVNTGNGCVHLSTSTGNVSNIRIENCIFESSIATSQRPPFVGFELNKNQKVENLDIVNCIFNDSSVTEHAAAVAIVNTNQGVSSEPAVLVNVNISNNKCNRNQGIYVTSIVSTSVSLKKPGLSCVNVLIKENSCGVIGFLSSSYKNSTVEYKPLGLGIYKNTCRFIGSLTSVGSSVYPDQFDNIEYAQGDVSIEGNFANWIQPYSGFGSDLISNATLSIIANHLKAYSTSYVELITGQTGTNQAIFVTSNDNYGGSPAVISSNIIAADTDSVDGSVDNTYLNGIHCQVSCNINNNEISGISHRSGLLSTDSYVGIITSNTANLVNITNNRIYRNNSNISYYVSCISGTEKGFVVDNIFDKDTIDGSVTNTTYSDSNTIVIERNKNQTVTAIVPATIGTYAISSTSNPILLGVLPTGADIQTDGTAGSAILKFWLTVNSEPRNYFWTIPLDIIPCNAYVVSASVTITNSSASGNVIDAGSANFTIYKSGSSTSASTLSLNSLGASGSSTMSIGPLSASSYLNNGRTFLELKCNSVQDSSAVASNVAITISNVNITYRW